MPRKPRSDSKLDALSEEQHALLAEWLTIENISYAEAKDRVLEKFGVATSAAALQSFYSSFAAPWKFARSKNAADSFAELMKGNWDGPTIERVKELAFDSLNGPRPDIETATALLKVIGDSAKVSIAREKVSLDTRKVKLLEAKAALADKATAIASNKELSEEEQGRQVRALFGAA